MRNSTSPSLTLAPSTYSRISSRPPTRGRTSTLRKPTTRPEYSNGSGVSAAWVTITPTSGGGGVTAARGGLGAPGQPMSRNAPRARAATPARAMERYLNTSNPKVNFGLDCLVQLRAECVSVKARTDEPSSSDIPRSGPQDTDIETGFDPEDRARLV